jgi:GR25 family glycosyltransferase involved in LPS biosynthesis
MKSFCINLKGARERRHHSEREFAREGIEVTFVRGIDARQSRLSHDESWITPGHIGCTLSHIMLAEQVRHGDYGVTVIFEDDPVLEPGFKDLLTQKLNTLPYDWDIAMISWFADGSRYDLIDKEIINDDWFRLKGGNVWGTCCYAIKGRKGAERLLDCISPITSHVDRMFHESAKAGKLHSYFLTHPLVWPQFSFDSQTA